METNYVYVVSFDGYLWGYGTEIYLLGVYSSRELAEKAVNVFKQKLRERNDLDDDIKYTLEPDITAIELDTTCELSFNSELEVGTVAFLGGYFE